MSEANAARPANKASEIRKLKKIDLHIHTTASDGDFTPSGIVRAALDAGLSAAAITDHDTVSGYAEAFSAAEGTGLEVVPGIEFSTKYGGRVHILGYFIDPDDRALKEMLRSIVEDRDRRNENIVQLMRQDGISVAYSDLKDRFGEVIGKPHFAEILVEQGICSSVREAFAGYLNKGMKYAVPRKTVPVDICIDLIRGAGGIAVLAHPFEYRFDKVSLPELIEKCMEYGVTGLECRHSSHTPGQMAYLERLAGEYGLLKTGGSDFHGAVKPDIRLGTGSGLVSVPYSWLEKMKEMRKTI